MRPLDFDPLSEIQVLTCGKTSGDCPAIDLPSLKSLTIDLNNSNEVAGFRGVMKASPNLEDQRSTVNIAASQGVGLRSGACAAALVLIPRARIFFSIKAPFQ